jgi:hypothetical protein
MIHHNFAQHITSPITTTRLSIAQNDSQPLAQNNTPWWFTSTVSALHTITKRQWLRIMVCYAEPVVVSHGVLSWASGCESCCVMLSQWLWIMVYYSEPLVVIHGVLCWASGCEWWGVMLRQWLWIMGCYAEPMVVNHGVLYWASGCELWCAMLSQWLWIMVCYA